MIKIPILVRCPKKGCEKIFNRGRKLHIKLKCPNCKKWFFIWEVNDFFRSVNYTIYPVEYEVISVRIMLAKKMYYRKRRRRNLKKSI